MRRHASAIAVACTTLVLSASAAAQTAFAVPSWAYPMQLPPAPPFDTVVRHRIPNSAARFTWAQVYNRNDVADWQPRSHPTMPPSVARGQPGRVFACAYCHVPNGSGRPENAQLAGLSAEYIVQQVLDMKSRARHGAGPANYLTTVAMRNVADSVSREELAESARYYSRLPARKSSRIVETATIPRAIPDLGLYFPATDGSREALGNRLIEMPEHPGRHELRDPAIGYIAYVPRGSIARGRALATAPVRDTAVKSCTSCHGPRLRGAGAVPALAGRSPSYMLRQLFAFRTGARATPASVPMNAVAARLTLDEMIAVVAWAGSLSP